MTPQDRDDEDSDDDADDPYPDADPTDISKVFHLNEKPHLLPLNPAHIIQPPNYDQLYRDYQRGD